MESLLNIKKQPVGDVVGALLSKSNHESAEAGRTMVRQAAAYGLNLRDYLTLAIQSEGEHSGYELALGELNLPVKNDFKSGITLQAASNTFQVYPGTRAMFPEVVDDMIRWATRQPQFETVEPLLANSRTINGVELLSTVVDEQDGDPDPYRTSTVSEGARIPVRSIRTGQNSVQIWKHGSALRTTYEFERRASIDLLVPHARRIGRELQASKVTAAVGMLVNGDGVHAAAPSVNQSSFDSATGATSATGKINFENFLYWLVQRAKKGVPVDTVVGNWDSAFKWAQMWKVDGQQTSSDADNFGRVMNQFNGMSQLNVPMPNFAVASALPSGQLLGYTRGETLEELIEAGSTISESERSILNQTMTYVNTENTGYKLAYGDTRQIYDYSA